MKIETTPNHIQFERGDEVCANCGRAIRNIIRVNGVPLGPECGKKYLPKGSGSVQIRFDTALMNQAYEAKRALRLALLAYVTGKLPHIKNPSDSFIATQMAGTLGRNSELYLVWQAYAELRKL